MSLRCHRFLITDDGTLFRLANAKLERMLRDPANRFHRQMPYLHENQTTGFAERDMFAHVL